MKKKYYPILIAVFGTVVLFFGVWQLHNIYDTRGEKGVDEKANAGLVHLVAQDEFSIDLSKEFATRLVVPEVSVGTSSATSFDSRKLEEVFESILQESKKEFGEFKDFSMKDYKYIHDQCNASFRLPVQLDVSVADSEACDFDVIAGGYDFIMETHYNYNTGFDALDQTWMKRRVQEYSASLYGGGKKKIIAEGELYNKKKTFGYFTIAEVPDPYAITGKPTLRDNREIQMIAIGENGRIVRLRSAYGGKPIPVDNEALMPAIRQDWKGWSGKGASDFDIELQIAAGNGLENLPHARPIIQKALEEQDRRLIAFIPMLRQLILSVR